MLNLTDKFIENLFKLKISDEIYSKAELCLIDYIGVTYVGAKNNKYILDKFDNLLGYNGSATIINSESLKSNAVMGAFINGFNAHTMELDDGHRFGMIHLGAVIISALLAVAESENISYRCMLKGIIIGYEAATRLALAMQPGHKKKGYHTTGTCGTIGAALGCAFAMNYDINQIKCVLSAATTSASGLLEIQENASQLKAYNVAHAAASGVMAFYMGKLNLKGPDDILGAKKGMLSVFSDTVNENFLIQNSNNFEIERIYVKPYAACRHCHSAIEASITLRNEYNIPIEEIDKIEVYTYELAIKGHNHINIQGMNSAKLSIPYSVAVAYINKNCGLDEFTDKYLLDRDVLKLTELVEVIEKKEYTQLSPSKRIAEVIITTKDGLKYKKCVEYAKGEPENAMSVDEIKSKFINNMKWCDKEEQGKILINLLSNKNLVMNDLFKNI